MVRFGTVKCFFSQEGKRYGFIEVDGDLDGAGVFFHADDHCDCSGSNWLEREPRIGDRVAFKMDEARKQRPKASLWTYEKDYRPRLKIGEPLSLRLEHLPAIGHYDLTDDDVCVGSLDVDGDWGRGSRTTWVEVILRSSTGELFQLQCWEGEFGGETTSDRAYRYVPELEVETPKRKRIVIDPAKEAA